MLAMHPPLSPFSRFRLFCLLVLALYGAPSIAAAPAQSGLVRVRLETSEGPIVLALDARHAPATTANFMAYVDDGRFDDTKFYRSARRKSDPTLGLVQGGISTDARRTLPPVKHEPTSQTGILHKQGTISMARGGPPGTAMGNFFITLGDTPNMDAHGPYAGYAAFGHVVGGMDTVRKILAKPTGGGEGVMRGQMILKPVRIVRAVRLDGVAKPTPGIKPWLLALPKRKPQVRGKP